MKKINNLSQDRIDVLKKIEEYETLMGDAFFCDVEQDPPSLALSPNDVDYLDKKFINRFKNLFARLISHFMRKSTKKHNQIEVKGLSNLEGITGGAIITSNHFAPFESACVSEVVKLINKKARLYIVIKEGNYQMKGMYGFLFKHADTLPLSSNIHTMKNFNKALKEVLDKGNFVLIYPEQSMWWNYKKPRPQKTGAAHFATKFDVPIIPCFVTLSDLDTYEKDGSKTQKYTIHIMKPIFKNPDLSLKDNTEQMTEINYTSCIKKYEEIYQIPLTYKGMNK